MVSDTRIFLCHADEDKDFVLRLHLNLKLKKVGTWFDTREIRAGDSLEQKIFAEGIPQCSHAVVVYSLISTTKDKGWVHREREAIKRLVGEGRISLVPVLIDKGVDNELLHEAAGTRYIPFLNWERHGVFQTYLSELLEAVGLGIDDDLTRFDSPVVFQDYWRRKDMVAHQAKQDLITIFEVPMISQKEVWNVWEKVNVSRFLSKKISFDFPGRLDLINYAISKLPGRWALWEEKGQALFANWHTTHDSSNLNEAETMFINAWRESGGRSWKAGIYLFNVYDAANTEAKALDWYERVRGKTYPTDRWQISQRAALLYYANKRHAEAESAFRDWLSVVFDSEKHLSARRINSGAVKYVCDGMDDMYRLLEQLSLPDTDEIVAILNQFSSRHCGRNGEY